MKEKGIGLKKATTLVACFELYKRMENIGLEYQKKILSSQDVVEYFYKKFDGESQEYFYCIYLDSARKMLESKLLFKGTLNYSLVHPREVFKYAYINGAVSLIFVHNHPTGEISPSQNDIEITSHLKKIGELHGIKVEDHIIIGHDHYYSFFENKLMETI
jgi:DNA repair protein RadC